MAPPSLVSNGGDLAVRKSPAISRVSSVYSEVQNSRLGHPLALPSVFQTPFKVVDGSPSSAAGNPGPICCSFSVFLYTICICTISDGLYCVIVAV
ncbi:putative diphosphate--fructose-6-phosphate 1-phosphotransferase [Helianthus anomalus]